MSSFHASEWSRLNEAVVGAVDDGDSLLRRFQPDTWAAIRNELNTLVARLEAHDVRVHRPVAPPTERLRSGTDFVFVRDSALVIADLVIETELRDPDRRQERYALRPVLEKFAAGRGRRFRKMDRVAVMDTAEGSPFLEGGDVMVFGKDLLIGHSGRGSSEAGIARLMDHLSKEYAATRVVLDPLFWHLDLALMPLREGLAAYYPAAFPQGLPAFIQDWELIELTRDEATSFAANGLVIDEKLCFLVDGQDRLATEIQKHGTEVEMLPFANVTGRNGGLRCATLSLERTG